MTDIIATSNTCVPYLHPACYHTEAAKAYQDEAYDDLIFDRVDWYNALSSEEGDQDIPF